MKYLPFIIAILLCICVLVLQPLQLVSSDGTRLFLYIGKTVPIESCKVTDGGYKCYMNSTEYFWLTDAVYDSVSEGDLYVRFRLGHPASIFRREA